MIETPDYVIPPLSEVKIIKVDEDRANWACQERRLFRVGYYRKRDGLDRVWLVDEEGNYCKAVNQKMIKTHFEVVTTSSVTDLFGVNSPVIQAIPIVPPTPWNRIPRKAGFVFPFCALPVAVAFGVHGHVGRGVTAGICASIFFGTIWLRWDLKGKFWFWITLCVIAAAHVPLLLFVQWSNESYGPYGRIPEGLADFAIVYGPIRLIEIAIAKRSRTRRLPQNCVPGG